MELKNKIGLDMAGDEMVDTAVPPGGSLFNDAVSALMGLGYTAAESSAAVQKADGAQSVEECIKQALKYLM